MPPIGPGDMDVIGQSLDFCGANIYSGTITRAAVDGEPEELPNPQAMRSQLTNGPSTQKLCTGAALLV